MEENPYESPAEIELPPEHTAAPPQQPLAARIKRVTQVITLTFAVIFFLIRAGVIPPQQVIVLQILFGGSMLGLVVIMACNYFVKPKLFQRPTPRRLRVK
ncbi:hypothetical protein [Anatilimnocola floriformis]|uniref:hypothetical protein n=1 Tax=Anatilimnocola floriformis TaxID=2948575 RepID=UPI0020C52C66|nr:hypothetical protein [Anatilimnocola floriformis]